MRGHKAHLCPCRLHSRAPAAHQLRGLRPARVPCNASCAISIGAYPHTQPWNTSSGTILLQLNAPGIRRCCQPSNPTLVRTRVIKLKHQPVQMQQATRYDHKQPHLGSQLRALSACLTQLHLQLAHTRIQWRHLHHTCRHVPCSDAAQRTCNAVQCLRASQPPSPCPPSIPITLYDTRQHMHHDTTFACPCWTGTVQ